jgi:hypothetical protein
MNKLKIVCMLIASIVIGTSITASAGVIDCGSIDITINDNVYGTVSPEIDIDETGVTLKVIEITEGEETKYIVDDNLTIPINLITEKDKVYCNKLITGKITVFRSFKDVVIKNDFTVFVKNGELIQFDPLFRNTTVADNISVKAKYEIDEETFTTGEDMSMLVRIRGGYIAGKAAKSTFSISLNDILSDDFLLGLGKIIKEFFPVYLTFEPNLQILTMKQVELHVDYELAGSEVVPEGYKLDINITEGEGSVKKDPNKSKYAEGTVVNLTAVPDDGYIFDHWEGDAIGTENPVSVTMNDNKEIEAYFSLTPVKITAKKLGIMGVKIDIKNQEDENFSDVEWNISIKGGILGKINAFSNGTIGSLTTGSTMTVNSAKILFRLGSATITINVKIPGETTVVGKHSATIIGPIILVQ